VSNGVEEAFEDIERIASEAWSDAVRAAGLPKHDDLQPNYQARWVRSARDELAKLDVLLDKGARVIVDVHERPALGEAEKQRVTSELLRELEREVERGWEAAETHAKIALTSAWDEAFAEPPRGVASTEAKSDLRLWLGPVEAEAVQAEARRLIEQAARRGDELVPQLLASEFGRGLFRERLGVAEGDAAWQELRDWSVGALANHASGRRRTALELLGRREGPKSLRVALDAKRNLQHMRLQALQRTDELVRTARQRDAETNATRKSLLEQLTSGDADKPPTLAGLWS
jgi:hypothetical protein